MAADSQHPQVHLLCQVLGIGLTADAPLEEPHQGTAVLAKHKLSDSTALTSGSDGDFIHEELWWLVRVDVRDAGGHAYDDACLECNHKHIGRIGDECANKLRGNRVVEDILINTLKE